MHAPSRIHSLFYTDLSPPHPLTHTPGSGKTHTMIGPRLSRSVEAASQSASNTDSNGTPPTPLYSEEEDGLVPRCLGAAFQVDSVLVVLVDVLHACIACIEKCDVICDVFWRWCSESRCMFCVSMQGIVARAESMDFKVTTSCIELYNEVATDLLGRDRNKQCQVRGSLICVSYCT